MATRLKTIKVPVNFGAVADPGNNTLQTLGTPTIYIPENSVTNPVTFVSVMLFVAMQDTVTVSGGSISIFTSTVQLNGAASATTVTISSATLGNTGENWGGVFGPLDYTAHFTTNYGTVTSKSVTVTQTTNVSTGTTPGTRGVYAWFEVTYTYSDTEANRIETICIPYESSTTTLTTTANTTFCTIPQLTGTGGWLNGYGSPVVRHRWIEVKGNCNNTNTTTDHRLTCRFDTGANVVLPTRESVLASDTVQLYQIDASALDTATTHTFQIWNSLASRWANLIVNEYVTFEYAVSGTTEILNYLEIPIEFNSPTPGRTSTNSHRLSRETIIPEPTTITMRNCAVELSYNCNASATMQMKVGSQASYRGYAMTSNVCAGAFMFQHRIDSGSASGSALTLAKGSNNIVIDLYRSEGAPTNTTGLIKLLYSSGVPSGGVDDHTHMVSKLMRQQSFTTTRDDILTSQSFSIPETNYWIRSANLQYTLWTPASIMSMLSQARYVSGEGPGDGWGTLFQDVYLAYPDLAYTSWNTSLRELLNVYPNDPADLMNIEIARSFRTSLTTASSFGIKWLVGYHSITSTVSGTISGSAGGTVAIALFRKESNGTYVLADSTSRSGNGSYSFVVYDDSTQYFVDAYESSTYKGVSRLDTPNTNFDISLSGGGAVTTGYGGG